MHGVTGKTTAIGGPDKASSKLMLLLLVTMTGVAPIDRRLIDLKMISAKELAWLNDYHARVLREVRPHVDEATRVWLDAATEPLAQA